MNRRQIVRAVFRPTHPETLKPGMAAFIGCQAHFMADHAIESGPYAGQREMWIAERRASGYWTYGAVGEFSGWVPEEDLEIVEVVEPGEA